MDSFWKEKIDNLNTAIENNDVDYLLANFVLDLAYYFRTFYDEKILHNVLEKFNLIAKNNVNLQLLILELAIEVGFCILSEEEEYYREVIRDNVRKIINVSAPYSSNFRKDFANKYNLLGGIYKTIEVIDKINREGFSEKEYKQIESNISNLYKFDPDNYKVGFLDALSKLNSSKTIFRKSLIDNVIKIISGNVLEKALAQEMIGDISEPLQSISWYDDAENIYKSLGLYRDLVRLSLKKIEKYKNDPSSKIFSAQTGIRASNWLLILDQKEKAKKLLFDSLNKFLQAQAYIELLETFNSFNIIENFPEEKSKLLEIILETFEKRLQIDPYNINLYIECSNWLEKFNVKDKKIEYLHRAYEMAKSKGIYNKLLDIANMLIDMGPLEGDYILKYVEALKLNGIDPSNFLIEKINELQKYGKNDLIQYLFKTYSNLIPPDKIQQIEKENLLSSIKNLSLKDKIKLLKDYIIKYPHDDEVKIIYLNNIIDLQGYYDEAYNILNENFENIIENKNKIDSNLKYKIYKLLLIKEDFDKILQIES
ncbi:MAG: hypothetical protein N2485_01870 [bacterium]|nr:hypothetical protein [bacterium]